MTYRQVLLKGQQLLEDWDIADSANDSFLLLEYVYGLSRTAYLINSNEEAPQELYDRYMQLIERRANHEPLQHITGSQEFMGLEFYVNEHVLIPRQDTEAAVLRALKIIENNGFSNILDMCTGSGCIGISIQKLAAIKDESADIYPKAIKVEAVDKSPEALKIAKRNNEALGASVEFVESDLFDNIDESKKYDLIISNPPYIRTADIAGLMEEVRDHEPRMALDGADDGLYFYKKISEEAYKRLISGGYIVYEIGMDQAQEVSRILEDNGFIDIVVEKDLAGLDRVVYGKLK